MQTKTNQRFEVWTSEDQSGKALAVQNRNNQMTHTRPETIKVPGYDHSIHPEYWRYSAKPETKSYGQPPAPPTSTGYGDEYNYTGSPVQYTSSGDGTDWGCLIKGVAISMIITFSAFGIGGIIETIGNIFK